MTSAFAHDGLVVSVDAPDADVIWLREFLEPAFAVVEGEPADARISFEAAHRSDVEGECVDGRAVFTLDSGAIRLPECRISGGMRLHDASGGLTIDVTGGGTDARIRYHASRLRARIRLMRIVREYAHNHSVHTRGLMLHAAAVTVGGAAVAIPGSKGAGKTTLALRLLAAPDVAYLANDRVLVHVEDQPRAIAVPTVIALRAGTRALTKDLTARLQQCGDFREHAGERHAHCSSAPVTVDDTWYVSPHQLCAALDRSLQTNLPLAAVLFPTGDRASGPSLRRLSLIEAAETLKEALLCRRSGQYASDVFLTSPGSTPNDEDINSWCHSVASRVACVACVVPDDLSGEDLLALLEDCLQPGA